MKSLSKEHMKDWKRDFPLLMGKNLIYLDNSATTQKPSLVIEAMNNYYKTYNANVHRGIHRLAVQATAAYEHAHQIAADFIGAEFEEIIFTKGTTESLNLLAYSLGKMIQPGDEIVLTEMEHHSNIVPWLQLAKEKGAVIKYIPLTEEYRLDLETAQKLITTKTKIVSVTHMSNVLGTINPVTELTNLAHERGAICIIDAAQSAPHLTINVKEIGCDFLAFSGHKMCGPTGIGVLYGKKALLQEMEPFLYGGDMIKEVTFTSATWNDLPWKFEAGTPPIAEAIGLTAAINYLQKIGVDTIYNHEQELLTYALEKMQQLPYVNIIGPRSNRERGAVLSFTITGIHPHDVSDVLDRYNIAVRGGYHCAMPLMQKLKLPGTTRASFYLYNTKEDVDILIEALKKVQEVFQ